MRARLLTAVGLTLAAATAAGCGQPGGTGAAEETVMMEIAPPPAMAPAADAAGGTAPSRPLASPAPNPSAARPVQAPRIAYVYRYGLELPVEQVPALQARHEQACTAAGPAVCQVVGSESRRLGRDQLTATLEIRATPAFVAAFRARLGGEADRAGGRIARSATDSEDLTRAMIDTEARVRALTTLRDRLQQLLATRGGPLDQLLATERELARVQGELDANRSTLEVLGTRVATSRLIIEYTALGQLAPDSAFRPVSDAASNALAVFMSGVAALILFFAGALPFLIVGVPIVWLILRWRRRVREQRLAAKRSPEARTDGEI